MKRLSGMFGLNSIQGRLTSIAFLFITATAVSMGIVGYRLTLEFESRRFHEHFSLLATYLASNAELGVLLGNERYLEGLTENMLAVSDVRVVEVFGRDGRVILRRAHPGAESGLVSVSAPVVAHTMSDVDSPFLEAGASEEVMGKVVMSYSLLGLTQLKEQLALRFTLLSLLLAIVPVVMYWRLSKAISAPLKQLLKVASQVSKGRTDVRAEGGSLREINTLSRAINDMLDGLESHRRELDRANAALARQQALAEVGKFSMTVAHEIKNPLAIIKGSLDILKKDGPIDPGMKNRMAGFIDGELERINRLVEDFLQFARPRPPALQAMPVGSLVDSLVQRVTLMDPGVRIDRGHPDEEAGLTLSGDPFLLERALLNIVRNAIETSGDRGGVCFSVVCAESELIFTVLDDGPGIDDEVLPLIFEPFFSTKSKGTGLGLAIAKDVVEAHGGSITVASHEGGGACFSVRLPVIVPETESVHQPINPSTNRNSHGSHTGRR
ncbi:MAG: HAMP domain-containing sensor histidine kinase [Desulfuromonadales bacterium]|nr:HAMP domain-containing sensor histidine kinase [Desulfuromonadales bacterium]